MWQKIIKDKRILGGITLLIVLAAVPLTLNLASQQQDIEQRAATPTSCSINNPIDAMLIIDKSGSMGPPVNTDDRITPAKAAAKNFVSILYQNGINQASTKKNQTGVVSFAQLTNGTEGVTTLDAPLTLLSTQTNVNSVNAKIDSIKIFGRTCTQCGVRLANEEIKAHGRTGVKKIVVLLTDGGANAYDGHLTATQTEAESAANTEVDKGFTQSGTTFFTIGLGKDVNTKFLQSIATRTGGKYYFAPTAADLDKIYQEISTIVGKGSVSGTVYNDANGSKTLNTNETGLAGWKVDLTSTDGKTTIATTTTDNLGKYTFQGVCDGSYLTKVTIQSGWALTTPTNPDYGTPVVTNGGIVTKQNFGVKQEAQRTSLTCSPETLVLTNTGQAITATLKDSKGDPLVGKTITWTREGSITQLSPTTGTTSSTGTITTNALVQANETTGFDTGKITASFPGDTNSTTASCNVTTSYTPKATSLTITVLLHGIGSSGDNVNADATLSNKTPVHTGRRLVASIYDVKDNKLVEEITSNDLAYDATKGNYSVTLNVKNITSDNRYIVRVMTDYHPQKQYPGAIQILANQNNTLPPMTFVAGDVDNNTQLDMGDYNAIIDCYSDIEAPIACDPDKKLATDLNDDGKVEQIDYNLFLREWLVQKGVVVGI